MTPKEATFLALMALGQFSVDEMGRVWRHTDRNPGSRRGATALRKVEARRADTGRSAARTGYRRIQYWTRDGRQWVAAHRIVWMVANNQEISESLEINHKNGDKTDNRPANLEAIPRRANTIHAAIVLGKRFPGQKLSVEDVMTIRDLFDARDLTMKAIAAMFGVTTRTIDDIGHRRTWAFLA